ncbi:MAG TPA: hypothetical protein VK669_14690, partial [Candidatus Limnocylindrales bacterium]|nr:hypothetical protein [Candidatus Limnocylindrales bacterium]
MLATLAKPEPKKSASSVSSSSTPSPVPPQSAPKFTRVAVNVKRAQTLTDPGSSVQKKHTWDSTFTIYVHETPAPWIQVVVAIETAASDEVFKVWNARIKSAWNDKFAITDRTTGVVYPIRAQIIRPTLQWPKHYTVDVVNQEKALGIRGLMGTEHMTKWGAHDPQDIPHEFGHMLGNKDEYGTVDGADWTAKYKLDDPSTHSIMRRGDEPVRERHFELIADQVKTVLGHDVKLTKVVQQPVPSVSVLALPRLLPVVAKKPGVSPSSSSSSAPAKSDMSSAPKQPVLVSSSSSAPKKADVSPVSVAPKKTDVSSASSASKKTVVSPIGVAPKQSVVVSSSSSSSSL